MKKVAFQLKFLVVVHAIEDVGCDLQQLFNEEAVRDIGRCFVYVVQHLGVPLEGFLLKLFISVYLIAFCLQNPAESFRVHVVDIALAELERVGGVIEYPFVVYF